MRKNFLAVLQCGTVALGWELYASDVETRRCYHRCKSRFCPSCGYRSTLQWLAEQEAALPDIPYSGVVFTMPKELWSLFKRNRHLLDDLPALGAAVIEQWLSMRWAAKALIIVVPHTFGGDLKFNTHLHILISTGGFQESTGQWIPRIDLNKNALMRMWRYAVITHLRSALKVNILKSERNTQDLRLLFSTAYFSEKHPYWIAHLDQITSKAHFLRYAARYVRRPPIAKWRIRGLVRGEVEFFARDRKNKRLVRTARPMAEFVRLLASHVPNRYKHAIRYFGLLAPRTKAKNQLALFLLLNQERRPRPRRLSWRSSILKYFGFDPMIDRFGNEMHWKRWG